jgi:tetratricopeptide (TPR) repeat protein
MVADPTAHRAREPRLSPAQAQRIIRQRLEPVMSARRLTPADAHRLARRLDRHSYQPGEVILPRHVRAGCLGLVAEGQVAVHARPGGDRPDAVLRPGDTFGEATLYDSRSNDALLQALTPCEVWFLRRADLEAVARRRHAWRRATPAVVSLAVIIVLVIVLAVGPVRRVLALGPMVVGEWCEQSDYNACADQAWTLAGRLSPSDANPPLALGTLYFKQGRLGAAERAFQSALALAPDLPEAYNNLGIIYARQQAHEQAITAFEQALELEPGNATVERNLAFSLQALHAGDQALAHYRQAQALGNRQASTQANMAIAYYEMGQIAKAADAARQAIASDPTLAPAYTILGAVALASHEPEAALSPLYRAIRSNAAYNPARFYLGLSYEALGRPGEALAAFEQALAMAADEETRVRIRRHIAELDTGQEGMP